MNLKPLVAEDDPRRAAIVHLGLMGGWILEYYAVSLQMQRNST
ncbi:MAG: hypothetical protein NTW87_00230 [Planctomycetota bacterium]|nr:hypothetical protein [Planctomycetota bacterium]